MYFFTSDEHYNHRNILKPEYCDRPFNSIEEHDEQLIKNHNEVVKKNDIVVHAGDFTLIKNIKRVFKIMDKLNGEHIFLRGSHDYWLKNGMQIWEQKIGKHYVVVCHYCMRTWARSHYNSIHLFGHSHGNLPPIGKSWDIGVDNNNYYPVSFNQIKEIMKNRPDNPGLVKKRKNYE